MSNAQQHDVDEADLTDIEEVLERDNNLANLHTHPRPAGETQATTSRAPSPPSTHPDNDTVYDGDIEDAGERHHARIGEGGRCRECQSKIHLRRTPRINKGD